MRTLDHILEVNVDFSRMIPKFVWFVWLTLLQVEQMASLQQRIEDLINEKGGLHTLNAELQKKAVALIAKEKAMQGQTAAARTAAEVSRCIL